MVVAPSSDGGATMARRHAGLGPGTPTQDVSIASV